MVQQVVLYCVACYGTHGSFCYDQPSVGVPLTEFYISEAGPKKLKVNSVH